MEKNSRIFIAGHRGLVGSAIMRRLKADKYTKLMTIEHDELDLRDQSRTNAFIKLNQPKYVFLAAAKVGGILANDTYPADFIHDNLAIQSNIIDAAYQNGVKRLLFLGSSCIYPKRAKQPISEGSLLKGPLEATNEAYAIAKIAGVKMCQAYRRQHGFESICLMPTNLYGPGDNFDLETSHVIPALIRKFHEAKQAGSKTVSIWGSGKPRREFMHVDDLVDACLFMMEKTVEEREAVAPDQLFNVGVGKDQTIRKVAWTIRDIVYPGAKLSYDKSKPDGTPQKLLDVSRMKSLGWEAKTGLEEGLRATYEWYRESKKPAEK